MTYLAVFDWNGTLFDDTAASLIGTNACLRCFNRPEIDLHTMQENFSFPLIHFYERLGIGPDDYLKHAEEENDVFLSAYEQAAASCAVAEGAFDLLDWLAAKNVHCMILSNHMQNHLDADVARLGIAPYMQCVSGNLERATITQGLSKQRRLEDYMAAHGFSPDRVFIVGDSHEEPELAHRLGILGVSISGGLLSAERLKKYKADYIIHKLSELRPILQKQWDFA